MAEWEGDAKPGVWHHLALEIRGDKLTVFFNGKQILTHVDGTFPAPGRVGGGSRGVARLQSVQLRRMSM